MGVTCPEVGVVDPDVVAELLTLVEEAESLLMCSRRGFLPPCRPEATAFFLDGVSQTEMLLRLREGVGLSPYIARSLATRKRGVAYVRRRGRDRYRKG